MSTITCTNCGAQYDGSNFPAGRQFACVKCGTTVMAGAAGAAPQAPQAGFDRRIASPGAQQPYQDQQPYMAQQPYGYQQTAGGYPGGNPYGNERWENPLAPLKERSLGAMIALYIVTLGIYGFCWVYFMHQELPRRQNDWNGKQFLNRTLIPYLIAIFLIFIGAVVMASGGHGPSPAGIGLLLLGFIPAIVGTVFYWIGLFKITKRFNVAYQTYCGEPEKAKVLHLGLALGLSFVPYVGGIISLVFQILWWVAFASGMEFLASRVRGRLTIPPSNQGQMPQQPQNQYPGGYTGSKYMR